MSFSPEEKKEIKSLFNEVLEERNKNRDREDYRIAPEQHYLDHQFVKLFRDFFITGRKATIWTIIGISISALVGALWFAAKQFFGKL